MSPTQYQNALEAAINLAQAPVLLRDPRTALAHATLLRVIDDGATVLAPTGKRVQSPTYAVSRWIQRAIEVTGCAHSSRLVNGFGAINDGGAA